MNSRDFITIKDFNYKDSDVISSEVKDFFNFIENNGTIPKDIIMDYATGILDTYLEDIGLRQTKAEAYLGLSETCLTSFICLENNLELAKKDKGFIKTARAIDIIRFFSH